MKYLKWLAGMFIIYAIGDFGKMYFSHSMSAIDKGMQKAVTTETPKLPARDDIGLITTRVSYLSPTLQRYITVPKGVDVERLYKQKLTDNLCTNESLWMFEKGFRVENIFQIDPASKTDVFDMSMPDKIIVIDAKQCQHRGEPVPVYIPPAPPVPTASVNTAAQVPTTSSASTTAYAVAAAPAAAPADTAAAVN